MNFLDLVGQGLDSYGANQMDPLSVVPSPTSQAPTTPAAPSVMDLLSQALSPQATTKAPTPQADMSMIPALAMLEFAARATAPKQRGQSSMNAIIGAGAGAMNSYMNNKHQAEDLAARREREAKQSVLQDEQIKSARVATAASVGQVADREAKRPKELELLEAKIKDAKTDEELKRVDLGLKRIREKYAAQEHEAKIAETNARTLSEKAEAAMRYADAGYRKRHAELLEKEIEAKRKNPPGAVRAFKDKEGLPGEPGYVFDETSGKSYRKAMDPAGALAYTTRQIDARAKMGEFKNSQEKEAARQELYRKLVEGDKLPEGSMGSEEAPTGSEPAKPAAGAAGAPKSGAVEPEMAAAIKRSADSGKGIIYQDPKSKQVHYYIAGKEVSKAEFEARIKKPAAATPAPTPQPSRPGQFNGQVITPGG